MTNPNAARRNILINYKRCIALLFLSTFTLALHADFTISRDGKPQVTIVRQSGATAAEARAADDLARALDEMTGGKFEITTNEQQVTKRAIIIGPGAAATKYFPNIAFTNLGPDEVIIEVNGDKLLLAGGRPRGTMYAVNRFLQEQGGVRWWTPWATSIPHKPTFTVSKLHVRYAPPFEYRAPYWFSAFEQKWKAHNESNDQSWDIPEDLGGSIRYKGFAHTFNKLVPPEKHFASHPEWFSMVNGKRVADGQLCLTNPELRDFITERVKEWLRESRDHQIVSVTQNDWFRFCECPNCKAIDDAEGSHAGTMISFVNYIAEKIEPEFPNVLVDTFAYQYTRKPPKTVKPRHNVTVRLCSIECNFREPLNHPSNAAFADDIKKWSAICSHLYIWDYVTDFSNYVHPHPNWFTIGPNIRFFNQYGVKGIFEEGAYAGYGAEMQEMRSWVLAQMMWNPKQDDRDLIKEFLNGYYGDTAGKLIYKYLELVLDSSKGMFLGCYLRKQPPPHLRFAILGQAEQLWQEAEKSVAADPEKLWRVRISHLPVRYAFIKYWDWLRHDCWEQNQSWPLPDSRKAVAEEFRTVCSGAPDKDWTHVRALSEHGLTVDEFLKTHGSDSNKQLGPPPPPRLAKPTPPPDVTARQWKHCIDLQDNIASLSVPGELAEIMPDDLASDRRAAQMPGSHAEWGVRYANRSLPHKVKTGRWIVHVVARVTKQPGGAADAPAFVAGIYDNKEKTYPASFKATLADVGETYHSFELGEVEFAGDRDIYIAPAKNAGVKDVWIDRVWLEPASTHAKK